MSHPTTIVETYKSLERLPNMDRDIQNYYCNRYIDKYHAVLMNYCPDKTILIRALRQGYQPSFMDTAIMYSDYNHDELLMMLEYYQMECPLELLEDTKYFYYQSDYINAVPDEHIVNYNNFLSSVTLSEPREVVERWKQRGVIYDGLQAKIYDIKAHINEIEFLDSMNIVYDKRMPNVCRYIFKQITIDQLTDEELDFLEEHCFYRDPIMIDEYLELTGGYIDPGTLSVICKYMNSFDKVSPDVWIPELLDHICQVWTNYQHKYISVVVYLLRSKMISVENLNPPNIDDVLDMMMIIISKDLDLVLELYEYTHHLWYEWFRKYLTDYSQSSSKFKTNLFKYLKFLARVNHDHPWDPNNDDHKGSIKLLQKFHLIPKDNKQSLHNFCVLGNIDQVKKICAKRLRRK